MNRTITVNLWLFSFLILGIFASSGRRVYEYWIYERPMEQCAKAKKRHCKIGDNNVYFFYKGEDADIKIEGK
jgi:hypothetical protein